MHIEWRGHSCFLFQSDAGTRLLTDPFNERVGYPLPNVEVDVVTVSHHHFDHCATDLLPGNPVIVDTIGKHTVKGLEISGISTYHDPENGTLRGKNTAYVIKMDGVKICHLGDLGHLLTAEQVSELGQVDIICIPVGGFYTITAEQACQVVEQLQPAWVLPMHYRFDSSVKISIAGVSDFVQYYSGAERKAWLDIEKDKLPAEMKVVVLELSS